MKKILGSILIFTLQLFASPLCDYNLTLSKHSVYVKESVSIDFSVTQKDTTQAMFFEFVPQKSDDYELLFIKKEIIPLSSSRKKSNYKYILFPMHEGNISVNFKLIVKQASLEDLHGVFTIGQYQVPNLRTTDTDIKIEKEILNVYDIPKDTELVGDYELTSSLDKTTLNSNEQVNIVYHFKGDGYIKDKLKKILPKIDGVHYYEDIVDNSKFNHHDIVYNYALLSDKNFTIPAVRFRCFSPKLKKSYVLNVDAQKIEVKKINYKNLLDDSNSYPIEAFEFKSIIPYINSLLLFLAGYISAYLVQKIKKRSIKDSDSENFETLVKKTSSSDELLKLLLSKADKRYEDVIDKLYKNRDISLSIIKKEILDA